MDNNLNDNVRTDVGTGDVSSTRVTAPKTSRLALLLSFAAGAAAAWIIMSITNQNNEVVEAEQQSASMSQSRPQPRKPAAQTGNKTNVPRPVTN